MSESVKMIAQEFISEKFTKNIQQLWWKVFIGELVMELEIGFYHNPSISEQEKVA